MKTPIDQQIKAIENTLNVIHAAVKYYETNGKTQFQAFVDLRGIVSDEDYRRALKNLMFALEASIEDLRMQNLSDKMVEAYKEYDIENITYSGNQTVISWKPSGKKEKILKSE